MTMRIGLERIAATGLVGAMAATGLLSAGGVASAEPGGIVISEIHYHPLTDVENDEFLELANTSSSPIDVSGWTFTAGIASTFPSGSVIPAGGYFVLSPDPARFLSLYGFAADASYAGTALSNGGETLTLTDGANVVDQLTYDDVDPWPTSPDGSGPSLELRGLLLDNSVAQNWGPSNADLGTPRAVNSIDGTGPLPKATDVVAAPQRPDPNQQVVVTARLPVGSVASLTYKVMFGADVSVPFLDDAGSPGGAGDGQYAGAIPGQSAGKLVRYRLEATKDGVAFTYPAAGDSINYEGVVVRDPSVDTQLPVFEWFMEDAVYDDILANHRYDNFYGAAVVAFDGQVIDNARMRVRGQSSRDNPKVNWKVDLPAGRLLDMRPLMNYPLDEFALQSDVIPKPILAWDTVGEAGARRLGLFTVRSQRNGDFFSVGEVMETMDGSWRDDQDVSDWAIYKGNWGALTTQPTAEDLAAQTNAGCPLCEPEEWLEKKERESEDYTDVWQLTQAVDAPYSPQQREWLFENIDIPGMVNYMALNTVMRHQDSNQKNWWISRDSDGTKRWNMWHWDLNRTWTTLTADKGEFLSPAKENRLLTALMADPDVSAMFYRRVRTLADEFLTPGEYEAKWDAEVGRYESDWLLDRAKWGGRTPSFARDRFVEVLEDRRTVIANNTGPGKPVPQSQAASPDIVINEIHYQPQTGVSGEFIELANPSSSVAVDISGWVLEGVDLTIPPGTVVLPRDYVVFVKDDVAFRQAYPADSRFVGAEFLGELDDSGETIRLMQGGRVVDQVTYASTAPWPTAAAGTGPSLELDAIGADNALATSWSAISTAGGTPSARNTTTTPSPETLFADTFTGTDGAQWGSAWAVSGQNGSATIASNEGRLATTNTSGAYARAHLAGALSVSDSELLFSYRMNSSNPGANVAVFLRGFGGWKGKLRPANGYGIQFTPNSRTVSIKKMVNGSVTNLISTRGVRELGTAKQWVRLQVVGNTIRYRVWSDGSAEPSTWTASVSDASVQGSGDAFVAIQRTSKASEAKSITLDDLTLKRP
jgi:hypothetical protein